MMMPLAILAKSPVAQSPSEDLVQACSQSYCWFVVVCRNVPSIQVTSRQSRRAGCKSSCSATLRNPLSGRLSSFVSRESCVVIKKLSHCPYTRKSPMDELCHSKFWPMHVFRLAERAEDGDKRRTCFSRSRPCPTSWRCSTKRR